MLSTATLDSILSIDVECTEAGMYSDQCGTREMDHPREAQNGPAECVLLVTSLLIISALPPWSLCMKRLHVGVCL
jgi:hypothetical protein